MKTLKPSLCHPSTCRSARKHLHTYHANVRKPRNVTKKIFSSVGGFGLALGVNDDATDWSEDDGDDRGA